MNEGAYQVLRALARRRQSSFGDLVRASGEAESVVRDALQTYAQWFENREGVIHCTQQGWSAYGQERAAREGLDDNTDEALVAQYIELVAGRPSAKRELDQIHATPATVVKRAQLLAERGEHQRGVTFLGDDDLCALALHMVIGARSITTVDLDQDILDFSQKVAEAQHWEHKVLSYDVREEVPNALRGKYGCVFSDPPYTEEGFRAFVSRGVELLKPDGALYVCFGQSRRALERGLQKQRVLMDAGLLVEQVLPDFNEYVGAESIGSRSALWICRRTAQTKPLITGKYTGELYTSRSHA